MTEHESTVERGLRAFRGRIMRLLTERMVCWGLAGAGVVALALVLVDLFSLWYITPEWFAGLAALGALAGFIRARLLRLSDLSVALTVERRCALQDRASTAVALGEADCEPGFRALVNADAARSLTAYPPRQLFPWRRGRHHYAMLAVWALALALFFLPSIPWFQSPETKAERVAMATEAKQLEEAAKELREDPRVQEDRELRELAKRMDKLAREMAKHRIPKREALKQLNQLQQDLQKANEKFAEQQKQRDAQAGAEASQAAEDALKNRSADEKAAAERAKQQMAAGTAREKLGKAERDALEREENLKALSEAAKRGDMAGTSAAMRKMGQQMAKSESSAEQRKQDAETMRKVAESMRKSSAQEVSDAAQRASTSLNTGTDAGQQEAAKALQGVPSPVAFRPGPVAAASRRVAAAKQGVSSNSPGQQTAGKPGGNQGGQGGQDGKDGQGDGDGAGAGDGAGNGNGSGDGDGNGAGSGGSANAGNAGGAADGGGPGGTGGTGSGGRTSARARGRDLDRTPEGKPLTHGGSAAGTNSSTLVDIPDDQRGAAELGSASSVPYTRVITEYSRSAESAIDRESVPPARKGQVRDYFKRLQKP